MINFQRIIILFLVANFYFTGTNMAVSPVTGNEESILTSIAVWPAGYYYLEGWEVQLEVSIWDANGQAVETGELHVTDLNGSTSIMTSISDQLALVNWVAVTDGLTGVHVFEVAYSDPNGQYLPCRTYQDLLIGSEIETGETAMKLGLDYPVFNVVKGQQVNPSGGLSCNNSVFPYFYIDRETAYLSVEVELNGNWKIVDIQYPSTGLVLEHNFQFSFTLPPWIPTGVINTRCVFSGSYSSDLAATATSFIVNLLPEAKSLVIFLQETTVERSNLTEQNVLTLAVQVPGFDSNPVMLDLDLLTVDGYLVKRLLVNHGLTEYSSQLSIVIPQDVAIGTYNLSATLIDATTGAPLASSSDTITVFDDLLVDNFYWNVSGQSIQPSQQVSGHLVSRVEDTFTALKTQLRIGIAGTGYNLFQGLTGDNGYILFSITMPEDISPGYHDIFFELSPLPGDDYYHTVVKTLGVILQKETSIIHQESSFLIRKQEGWFNATVVDEQGIPVGTGSLSLVLDNNVIYSSASPSSGYKFTTPADMPLGVNLFTWEYAGNSVYSENEVIFPVAVHSIPIFSNLSSITSEMFPGEEIEITGRLVEETGNGIGGATVQISHRDNWGNNRYYTVLTGTDGDFAFKYSFGIESLGTHFFTVEFSGWSEEYYLPVDGKPVFELSIIPGVTLLVDSQLVAGENATLEFHGKPDQEIIVEILEDGNWIQLVNFPLDTDGKHSFIWSIPKNLKGEVLLRAGYLGEQNLAIFTLSIHTRPQLDIQVDDSPFLTDKEVNVLVSCNEEHGIWLDGKVWQERLSPGTRKFTLVFDDPGDHELEVVVNGDYVVETARRVIIQVRNDYHVIVNIPPRVQRTTGATFNLTVVDNYQYPLEGFKVELLVNDSLIASTVTSQEGKVTITLKLTTGFYQLKLNIFPLDPEVHVTKQLVLGGITVYSVPTVEIFNLQPVKGRSVNVKASMTDGSDPIAGEPIYVYLKDIVSGSEVFIGSNITDDRGVAMVAWNVTQESGEYLLQVETSESQFIESVVITRAVNILDRGPEIIFAEVITQDSEKNLYIVTALVDFSTGEEGVYLYSSKGVNLIGALEKEEDVWELSFRLEKGIHNLWLQAVDVREIDSWKELVTITVVNDLHETSTIVRSNVSNNLTNAIKDTIITVIFMIPVVVYLVYKKRKRLVNN
ncbi:MAG: carboxypeptidase-like regulatory domain-containing protein [Candidatus Odinarchaeota archaeon]